VTGSWALFTSKNSKRSKELPDGKNGFEVILGAKHHFWQVAPIHTTFVPFLSFVPYFVFDPLSSPKLVAFLFQLLGTGLSSKRTR
jgi:hypothetical protein